MLDQHALTRTKGLIVGYDFEDLFDPLAYRRERAVRAFDILIEAATPLPHETALDLWIKAVRVHILHPVTQEHLIAVFAKSLKQAQAKKAATKKLDTKPFFYDGSPVVVPPRVIAVSVDAGRAPKGTNYGKARQHLDAYDQRELDADLSELVMRLKRVVNWFDRVEGSKFDMTGYIDYVTRGLAAQLDNKRKYLGRIQSEMNDISRAAKNDDEFNETAWRRLSSLKERIIMSGFMLKEALVAHEIVRTDTYAYCGMEMDTFRSFEEMRKDRKQHNKLKVAEIDADKLVGLTPEEFAVWRRVTGQDLNGVLTDGVDALPDEQTAARPSEVRALRERQKRADTAAAVGYTRRKPVAQPKKGVEIEPSGERGSRYAKLAKQQK